MYTHVYMDKLTYSLNDAGRNACSCIIIMRNVYANLILNSCIIHVLSMQNSYSSLAMRWIYLSSPKQTKDAHLTVTNALQDDRNPTLGSPLASHTVISTISPGLLQPTSHRKPSQCGIVTVQSVTDQMRQKAKVKVSQGKREKSPHKLPPQPL